MIRTVAIVAFVLALTALTVSAQSKGGGECPIPGVGNFECPPYTFNTTSYGVELRSYGRVEAVICPLVGRFNLLEVEALFICYPEMDAYFNGDNVGRVSIERTAPVSQYWAYDFDSGFHFYYSIFYIPSTAPVPPPAPRNERAIWFGYMNPIDAASLRFSPNATAVNQEVINYAVFNLSLLLNTNKVPFISQAHQISWYEPPFLPPRNLKNEIWAFLDVRPNATVKAVSPLAEWNERFFLSRPKETWNWVGPRDPPTSGAPAAATKAQPPAAMKKNVASPPPTPLPSHISANPQMKRKTNRPPRT